MTRHARFTTFGTCAVLIATAVSLLAAPVPEEPWHEPGGVLSADFLKNGKLRYTAKDHEIIGYNQPYFNNRPLYCQSQNGGVVLAGDRPFVRFGATPFIFGGFSAAIVRDGAGKWLHDFAEVETDYRCGRMMWRISDPTFPGLVVTLETVPLQDPPGFALRLAALWQKPGDKLIWAFGGGHADSNVRGHWDPITHGTQDGKFETPFKSPQYKTGMELEACRGNKVVVEGSAFRLWPATNAEQIAVGKCSRAGTLFAADASAYANPEQLAKTPADHLPMVCGEINLAPGSDVISWAIEATPAKAAAENSQTASPAKAFADGLAYLKSVERAQIETPDARLDAAFSAVCHAIDAHWDRGLGLPRHGCMLYSTDYYLGWRQLYGSTALGWHDLVRRTAAYYIASQVQAGDARTQPQPDPGDRYCTEGAQSRFYGSGRISKNQYIYNMQTQFFDQLIHEWRWTADPGLEKILRPALELHLKWEKECFDPDNDGLYESYINTMPTDNVWYNGGGSVEESAYAYYARLAAMELARRAGNANAANEHFQEAEKIQRALRNVLWLKDKGYFGSYVEQGGHHRVHTDAWLGSEFLPIDAGLTTAEEALQSLFYTEWGLERDRFPFGGEICQLSNWVPSPWSVRDLFNGDTWQLALAYFQTGLGDEGWELLLGGTLESAYASVVPGGFSQVSAATDLADSSEMFARTVVEGLFGFDPDYPNGLVRLHPAFPSSWPTASITTPDYALHYQQNGDLEKYALTLAQSAAVDFRFPVRAGKIRRVMLNGQPVPWQTEAGFGCTYVRLKAGQCNAADIEIQLADRLPQIPPMTISGEVGSKIQLAASRGKVVGWEDFHTVIEGAKTNGATLRGNLASKPGHHLVVADVTVGALPQRQVFKLNVTDAKAQARLEARTPRQAPATAHWECLDLTAQYNGDVRTIFQQSYLSPRPKTCSVRLGVDGYSGWCFGFWQVPVPVIDLANLPALTDNEGRIQTPQHAPFTRFTESNNIAFTSLWDNWPHSVTVPVNKKAAGVWLLICGSTFPMQTRIANAAVHFRYADGQVETLELVPPLNFWSLCPWCASDNNYQHKQDWDAFPYIPQAHAAAIARASDYNYESDAFALPEQPPPTVQLGNNCRAMVLSWNLRPGEKLQDITLETLSQDVVIGLMGVSLMRP